jgi:glucoamylase
MSTLEDWIEKQYARAAAGLLRSISPTAIVKTRPQFHQTIFPRKGAIVASPVLGAYDPEPDYFFHWYRDSAIVMDALRLLYEDAAVGGEALMHLADFVDFSLSLSGLDGRAMAPPRAMPDYEKHLRKDLASAHGDAIPAETRVNADGTLDITDWPRPQHDGPAMRALTLQRWLRIVPPAEPLMRLLRADLDFVAAHACRPCFDIWEEEMGHHYYTLRVSAAALALAGDTYDTQVQTINRQLDGYWRAESYYGSRAPTSPKDLDISVILAAIHAGGSGPHSPDDPKIMATLDKLDALFDASYTINRRRPAGQAPALGRYRGDVYYSGGAYYFATLAGAELCFRAGLSARGNAYLETVRAFAPESGALSEQFDQATGQQTSARDLAWSYAAFISCIAARRSVKG